jgi:hypothetical protein
LGNRWRKEKMNLIKNRHRKTKIIILYLDYGERLMEAFLSRAALKGEEQCPA